MSQYYEKLQKIAQVFLSDEEDYGLLFPAIQEYLAILNEITDLDYEKESLNKEINSGTGRAISTAFAAHCVSEILRTKMYVKGLYLGIKKAQKLFPNERIHILYAGTGPFATIALPMMSLFSEEEIRFTLLEINLETRLLLDKVIDAFQFQKYIEDIIVADAAKLELGEGAKDIHILLSETMQQALVKEPQVAIVLNLLPQISPKAILIPENIEVSIGSFDRDKSMKKKMGDLPNDEKIIDVLSPVFSLTRETINENLRSLNQNASPIFPLVKINLPEDFLANPASQVALFTTIQVCDTAILNHWECSLTLPYGLGTPERISVPLSNQKIEIQYSIQEIPGYKIFYSSEEQLFPNCKAIYQLKK